MSLQKFYILFNNKTYSRLPENSFSGTSITFKKGWFIFDTSENNVNFYISEKYIEINHERFNINKSLIFSNKIKAEIEYLKLKIKESEENGYAFYMPTDFKKLQTNLKELSLKYPEYIL